LSTFYLPVNYKPDFPIFNIRGKNLDKHTPSGYNCKHTHTGYKRNRGAKNGEMRMQEKLQMRMRMRGRQAVQMRKRLQVRMRMREITAPSGPGGPAVFHEAG
jgi:hypothetical protein